jgi:ATP-dependent HslUV protease subunit HslV
MHKMEATTIVAVLKDGSLALAGDGQVTFGDVVFKHGAKKIRKMDNYDVLTGFAGTASDAFALMDKFEQKLDEYKGNLKRAAVELAKDWRNDKALRMLDAMLIVGDRDNLYVLSGSGDVIDPDDGVVAIGSGGNYAFAAAKALLRHSTLKVEEIAEEAMRIAGEMCVYTNLNISCEVLN